MALAVHRGATIITLLALLVVSVHNVPLHAEEISEQTGSTATDIATEDNAAVGVEGTASYYAKRYNGRRTNSGARYNPAKLTAAHPDLPHGTRVKVVNLSNKKEVVVTINDRCRKRKGPVIDLSRAAAGKLGFLGKGTARVMIIPLTAKSS